MRPGRPVAIACAAWLAAAPASGQGSPGRDGLSERCPGPTTLERVAAVTDAGEIRLQDGAAIRIADIRLPDDAAAPGARAWLRSLAGEPVEVARIDAPDRWGRAAARVTLPGRAPVDAAELLVGEGLAMVDAGPRDALCRPGLLAAEAAARRGRTGLWRDAASVAADDLAALAARAGSFAIVEGRIASVGVRRERIYLNFGRDFARDFSVVIPKRSWAALAASGRDGAAFRGRRVRVRGLLEMRRAPGMEIAAGDMVEILDEPSRR